jgi:hypothetical protein
MVIIAKWVSQGGKYWVELRRHADANGRVTSYSYRCNNGGGTLAPVTPAVTDETATRVMQTRVDCGLYLPDAAVRPMERII